MADLELRVLILPNMRSDYQAVETHAAPGASRWKVVWDVLARV